ncbi:long-subunit fatty acid transport protein [Palleronia aestuarii]|uniref:Long-subunit fatty acid transport protein n=1 Tax=Palleronia aestuarii TaxID=568105 RepID=A0A2W7NE69_9RHOB|nr:outer membrane protein transport protein [Palleronia aestuarii]PZX18478.1 long-subunit fatty acid transport protein [Palleronia aestuarii]
MMKSLGRATVIVLVPAAAGAVGLDRSGQSVEILFTEGNMVELTLGRVLPDASGTDTVLFGGSSTGNVLENFNQATLAVKYEFDERFSAALILEQPYGIDTSYPSGADGSIALGGTEAVVDSDSVTALLRYRFDDAWSVHGGVRYQRISPYVALSGAAYGPLDGYEARFDRDGDLGFVIGGAYEMPEIALRVALTYFSGTEHELSTRETLNGVSVALLPVPFGPLSETSTTDLEAPESINLDFQTGIAPETLLFGSIRYAKYGDVIVAPTFFDAVFEPTTPDSSLTDLEDGFSYTIGVGRQFTDRLSASVAFGYDDKLEDDLVSPLAPVNGTQSFSVGAAYAVTDALEVAGGVSYIKLGDAQAETGDDARAIFDDSDAWGFGLKVGYSF